MNKHRYFYTNNRIVISEYAYMLKSFLKDIGRDHELKARGAFSYVDVEPNFYKTVRNNFQRIKQPHVLILLSTEDLDNLIWSLSHIPVEIHRDYSAFGAKKEAYFPEEDDYGLIPSYTWSDVKHEAKAIQYNTDNPKYPFERIEL